jgi:hypothetical protein
MDYVDTFSNQIKDVVASAPDPQHASKATSAIAPIVVSILEARALSNMFEAIFISILYEGMRARTAILPIFFS